MGEERRAEEIPWRSVMLRHSHFFRNVVMESNYRLVWSDLGGIVADFKKTTIHARNSAC